MIKKMGIEWNLRLRMAERGMFATTDLVPQLAERGVHLSREQVYRLVTAPPQRLSTDTLAALCDILDCTPNDLISVVAVDATVARVDEVEVVDRPAKEAGATSRIWANAIALQREELLISDCCCGE